MHKNYFGLLGACIVTVGQMAQAADPTLLDDQFQLPPGFHIYKAAESNLTQGSYVLTFDGSGDLLVGTGRTIRRLSDENDDGVYDAAVEIVGGLGPRGPQGILVHDDNLYAVGGDGVQHYTGYPDNIVHQGRLGNAFNTGGDHAAHTLLRGHDDWIYLVSGDGGGTRDRVHITEETSPVLRERKASVFRFDLTGTHWECISTGGRNPPNLGMNSLGELFSLDSDMEFHVDVPFYRPVRLNHWGVGADLGWQGAGAYPPYYIDTIPGTVDVGRGSPTWGTIYEHEQLPDSYRDAFLVCDYRWKSATHGTYNSSGRLLSFSLQRAGSSWGARMETLAMPKPEAVDSQGRIIDFALVDVTVSPDGSLFISDHNQGVWRLFYSPDDPQKKVSVPPIVPAPRTIDGPRSQMIEEVLALPQPQSEWTRRQVAAVKKRVSHSWRPALQNYVLTESHPVRKRLRALRLIAPEFSRISGSFFVRLAKSKEEVLRGQAAWLTGLQGGHYHPQILHPLLSDASPFVRRRAAEALIRVATVESIPVLVRTLEDPDRMVRYAAMQALSHLPTVDWFELAVRTENPQRLMRALVAANLRGEKPESTVILSHIQRLLGESPEQLEDQLDLLRVLDLFATPLRTDPASRALVSSYLQRFPEQNAELRWEQARLLGRFGVEQSIPTLLDQLESEPSEVTQFHLASALSQIRSGWDQESSTRLIRWLLRNQTGWFAEFAGKGLQFSDFWRTVLNRFYETHGKALEEAVGQLSPNGQLGKIVIDQFIRKDGAEARLVKLYRNTSSHSGRLVLLETMKGKTSAALQSFVRDELNAGVDEPARIFESLVGLLLIQGAHLSDASLLWQNLKTSSDPEQIDRIVGQLSQFIEQHGLPELQRALGYGKDVERIRSEIHQILQRLARLPAATRAFDQAVSILTGHQRNNSLTPPRWIWARENGEPEPTAYFRRQFSLGSESDVLLEITGDNEHSAFIDGQPVSHGKEWTQPNVESFRLSAGTHEIAVRVRSDDRPAGLLAGLTWVSNEGRRVHRMITNVGWQASTQRPSNWPLTDDSEVDWQPALDLGGYGVSPWGEVLSRSNGTAVEGKAVAAYWSNWFQNEFGQGLPITSSEDVGAVLSKEALRDVLLTASFAAGNQARGKSIYVRSRCHTCHQGVPEIPGPIFGPDLVGVTRRLTREQLADAILTPSKEVAERFQATEVESSTGEVLSGFITERDAERLVIATQAQLHTLPIEQVQTIRPLETSLMPEGLLEGATEQEVMDLLHFLDRL